MEKLAVSQFSIEELIDLKDIQKLMDVMYNLTGVPVIIADTEEKIIILSGNQKFCSEYHHVAEGKINCQAMKEVANNVIPDGSIEFVCDHLITSIGIPVTLEDTRIATVFLGQFLFEEDEPDRQKYIQNAEKLLIDPDQYLKALDDVPRFSRRFINNAIEFHGILAHLISTRCQTKLNLIREEEQAGQKIKDHEELLSKVMDTTSTAIMMYQNDKWVYTNRAGCEICGFSEEELMNMRYYDFIHPDDREMIYERGQARQSGAFNDEMRYDFRIITREGKEKWVHLNGAVASFNGKPAGLISVLDISELKETEFSLQQKNEEIARQNEEYIATNEELNQTLELLKNTNQQLEIARNKAEESDRLKSAFLANMSHEIRTPMNAILGFSRLLLSEQIPLSQQKTYIQQILTSGDQLLRIINDIIDISKIEANILKVDFEPVNINAIIPQIADKQNNPYRHPFKENVEVVVNIPHQEKDFYIESDKVRLTQIINNLVNNAAKYTFDGVIEVGYNIHTRNNREYVEIFVKDTGIGIKKEHHEEIFNRFIQAGEQSFSEGNGLGLSIVKGLSELLGGEVRMMSEPDNGSTFSVVLPHISTKVENGEKMMHLESTTALFDDKLMYIAEDDSSSAFLIQEILRDTGISIRIAGNGAELIRLINEQIPDVVILDINMPVMNGYETIREIRKKHDDLPVVAQTAYAMPDEKERILDAGCSEYISKPLDANLFILTLKKVLV